MFTSIIKELSAAKIAMKYVKHQLMMNMKAKNITSQEELRRFSGNINLNYSKKYPFISY